MEGRNPITIMENVMPTTTDNNYTIWCCDDCVMLEANGCTIDGSDYDPDAFMSEQPGYSNVSLGMMFDEHECDDPELGTCECETDYFSFVGCQSCGSSLGGGRYAMTVWFPAE